MLIILSICSTCGFQGATFIGNLISFNQGSSQVDSLDLVDVVPNKGIWGLGQAPINVPTLKQLLDIYPNKSDLAFLVECFELGLISYLAY